MATHSSILSWEIPWTEEPAGLQSMGSQRVGHDWVTEMTGSKKTCLKNTEDFKNSIINLKPMNLTYSTELR